MLRAVYFVLCDYRLYPTAKTGKNRDQRRKTQKFINLCIHQFSTFRMGYFSAGLLGRFQP
jgi:hypothetical protein